MNHESNSNHQSINNIKQIAMEHDEQTFNNAYGRPRMVNMVTPWHNATSPLYEKCIFLTV